MLAALSLADNNHSWDDTSAETTVYSHTLSSNEDNKFRIIQLGDLLHTGGDFSETENLIRNLVKVIDPQLLVLTGEIVDPSVANSANFKELYHQAMEYIVSTDIPWVWTGGSNIPGLTRD